MLLLRINPQGCARLRTAAALMGLAMLAGCSSGGSGGGISSFFASPGTTLPPPAPGAPLTAAVAYEGDCPGVEIRRGTGTMNLAARGAGEATAGDLRYQLSLRQTARECLLQGTDMTIRVGVQGRIVLGPQGGPGQVDIPLRYAVVHEGAPPRTIVTKFKRFVAPVSPNETNVEFTDVEEGLTFPLPPPQELGSYVIYVGFDEAGDPAEKKPAKPGKKAGKKTAKGPGG
jgi:hypothetical protein